MTSVPFLPKNAPFTAEDIDVLNQLVQRSSPLQRSWLSGFLAGLDMAQMQPGAGPQPAAPARPRVPLTILFGSESGNTEGLAMKAKKLAAKLNFDARIVDMADVEPASLAKVKNLIVYISTWGEGDPPQRAADFYQSLLKDAAPRLDGLRFAVLSLGDTAYVNFCQTGKVIDARLEALGATRVADRVDLDLDFAKAAAAWTEKALGVIAPADAAGPTTVVHVDFKGGAHAEDADEPLYTAERPLEAEITTLINLSGSGSTRETWHVELQTDAPGFTYKPGAAIGILPENDPALAAELLQSVGLGSDAALTLKLARSHDITTLSRAAIDAYAKIAGRKDVAKLLEVLHRLVDGGNTVLVIEHNLDVIKTADWIVDLGPAGGARGGRIIAEGTPEKVAATEGSATGEYLDRVLRGEPLVPLSDVSFADEAGRGSGRNGANGHGPVVKIAPSRKRAAAASTR